MFASMAFDGALAVSSAIAWTKVSQTSETQVRCANAGMKPFLQDVAPQ
jgi:hypothetical protein